MTDLRHDPEYARRLAIATYHTIKEHPKHHRQEAWRCGSGFCMAGWVVALDAVAQWLPSTNDRWSKWTLNVDLPIDHPSIADTGWINNNMPISDVAEWLLGARYSGERAHDMDHTQEYEDDEEYGSDLFHGSNTLSDIRNIMIVMFDVDPEDEVPDPELMVRGKQSVVDRVWA